MKIRAFFKALSSHIEASWPGSVLFRFFARGDVQAVLHCAFLIGLMIYVRPMFTARVPRASYEANTIVLDLLQRDLNLVSQMLSGRHRPEVPRILFLAVPTLLALLPSRRITWARWDRGRALRFWAIGFLLPLVWSGSMVEYNLYLDRFHAIDRVLLIALLALAWRTPLAVPPATAWAIVMIHEAYIPTPMDDFDYRPVAEVLIVFSCFAWASIKRSFDTKHFVWVGLGAWASYYYAAGVAKVIYGPESSWLLENNLTNLAVGAHVRGWLGFVPERAFLGVVEFLEIFNRPMSVYTLVVELGALACFFLSLRLARLWALLCFVLHLGIFAMSGVCFWKWGVANIVLFAFLSGRGGKSMVDMYRRPAVILLGIASVYFSRSRVYFYPQTGVAWYDSRFVENYELVAVGQSGERYIVDPTMISPMDMHWVQGRLCYATKDRSITGIYGVTGSYSIYKALENAKSPDVPIKLLARARACTNPGKQKTFNEFIARYFGNMNRHRGRPASWLTWVGPPSHLWVQPRGRLYKVQEPIARIEVWRELVFHHAGKLHRTDRKVLHHVDIPRAPKR